MRKIEDEIKRIREGIKNNIYLIPKPCGCFLMEDQLKQRIKENLTEDEKNKYRELEVQERMKNTISWENCITKSQWIYYYENKILGRKYDEKLE